MSKELIETPNAPKPIGPYSQATIASSLLFISGQIALKPGTSNLVIDTIPMETEQVMKNLQAILEKAGSGFENVVKTTIFLSDMKHFEAVNKVYGSYFEDQFPARETVAVNRLPKNVNVEISMIASL